MDRNQDDKKSWREKKIFHKPPPSAKA